MSDRDNAERTASGSPFAGVTDLSDVLLNRWGLRGELSRDCALAAVLAVLSAGMVWLLLDLLDRAEGIVVPADTGVALGLTMVAQSLLVCVRRRFPTACLMGITALQVLALAVLPAEVGIQGLALFVAAYTCGTLLAPRRLVVVITAATLLHGLAGALVLGALAPDISMTTPLDGPLVTRLWLMVVGIPVFVAPALLGVHTATRRRYVDLLRVRADEEIRAQRERAEGAIRSERTRMARELHDIAAHHLSGMVVQAGAAERLVGRDDQAAREAMAWVRAQGRETLNSLRLVVGALRDPGDEVEGLRHHGEPGARGAPVPGLAARDRLVEAERELGTGIELTREGEPFALPPVADVTAYRLVQESLSNVRDHAHGASVRLSLRYGLSRVCVEVENGAGGARTTDREHRGLGLLGMRERAQMVGATLETGPTAAGGWRVRWEVPVEREEHAVRDEQEEHVGRVERERADRGNQGDAR